MTVGIHTLFSIDEYFELEYAAETRHEYVDGKMRTMPYTSENHQHIVAELIRLLGNALLDMESNSEVFGSDKLLFAEECNRAYYPDVTIFPSEIEYRDHRGKMKAAMNPTVIIEVLSESTERIDRSEKMHCYKKIPSVQQYILISQEKMLAEIFEPVKNSKDWLVKEFENADDQLTVGGCKLTLKSIYRRVKFEEKKTETD